MDQFSYSFVYLFIYELWVSFVLQNPQTKIEYNGKMSDPADDHNKGNIYHGNKISHSGSTAFRIVGEKFC